MTAFFAEILPVAGLFLLFFSSCLLERAMRKKRGRGAPSVKLASLLSVFLALLLVACLFLIGADTEWILAGILLALLGALL